MRRTDLSPDRQRNLVKCDEPYTHCKALVPPPALRMLPLTTKTVAAIQRAHEALGRLQAEAGRLPNTDLITRTLARREAVHSSQIEGTQTRLPELLEYEATCGADGSSPDMRITERYVTALSEALVDVRATPPTGLSLRLVQRLHQMLIQDNGAHVRPGEWRQVQAWIGAGRIEDAIFVPPPPSAIDACMRELESSMLRYAMNEDEFGEISIVSRLAITHAHFETIHPFVDGNGRVGRLLMPLMLVEAGYPALYLSGYLLRYRHAYYDALAAVQLRNEWDPWTTFLCNAIVNACDTSLSIARDMNAIADDWMLRLADIRKDALVLKVPRLLLGHPITSVNELAALLDTSFPTAAGAIDTLVSRGILQDRHPERRRNRLFHARQLLERLERE